MMYNHPLLAGNYINRRYFYLCDHYKFVFLLTKIIYIAVNVYECNIFLSKKHCMYLSFLHSIKYIYMKEEGEGKKRGGNHDIAVIKMNLFLYLVVSIIKIKFIKLTSIRVFLCILKHAWEKCRNEKLKKIKYLPVITNILILLYILSLPPKKPPKKPSLLSCLTSELQNIYYGY